VLISQYHGEGVARRQVIEGDKALATAIELLEQGETLSEVFQIAEKRGEATEAALEHAEGAATPR
jgi:hypothetical protein